jgi:hypothetical protein
MRRREKGIGMRRNVEFVPNCDGFVPWQLAGTAKNGELR